MLVASSVENACVEGRTENIYIYKNYTHMWNLSQQFSEICKGEKRLKRNGELAVLRAPPPTRQ